MAEAAGLITEHYRPEFIDINFGCPVKKVVQRNGGSGCLRDLELVDRIIRAVIGATHLPVTVKTRSGWNDEQRDPVGIALRMQDAGARAFTLHARTRTQMFSGKADWDEIARVVEALDIPVIGNGDVQTAEDVVRMRDHTGCAGVMIGRGAFGNPWLFRDGRALLAGAPRPAPAGARSGSGWRWSTRAWRSGSRATRRKTVIEFRKHLGWYTKGLHGASDLRQRLFQVESIAEAEAIFLRLPRAGRRGGVRAEQLEALLADVAAGRLAPGAALERLRHLPYEDLDFARIDHHRALRQGQPEVVFCEGKTLEQVVAICERLDAATGALPRHPGHRGAGEALRRALPARGVESAGPHRLPRRSPTRRARRRAASWSSPPAPATCRWPRRRRSSPRRSGTRVERLMDVGVAGLHRLLSAGDTLQRARVVIVVAGMEGALPSVVGGLVAVPVIAVPTSVGLRRLVRRARGAARHAQLVRGGRHRGQHRQRLRRRRRRQPDLPRMTHPHRARARATRRWSGSTWCSRRPRSSSEIAARYGLQPTAVKDCLDPEHLPKFEQFDDPHVRHPARVRRSSRTRTCGTVQELTRKVAIFSGPDLPHHHSSHRAAVAHRASRPAARRAGRGQGRARRALQAFLLTQVLNAAVDTYLRPMEQIEARIDAFEELVFSGRDADARAFAEDLREIHVLKRQVTLIKRLLWRTLDVVQRTDARRPVAPPPCSATSRRTSRATTSTPTSCSTTPTRCSTSSSRSRRTGPAR